MRIFFVLLLGVAASACSPLKLVNGISPSDHYELTSSVAYGGHSRQTLDVYKPHSVKASSPAIVFFYGGGWRNGNKENYEFVASSLTEAGYVVIIPDYRVFPEVTFPTFIDDGADAVAWALENASLYGADSDEVFLMGHSSGAHIAGLLVADGRFLAKRGVEAQHLAGFVGLSGPYDFLPIESGYLLDVFPEDNRDASQPVNFVTADAPPTLLIHGADDSIVSPANSESMARRLSEHGVDVTLKLYEGAGHAKIVVALAPALEFAEATLEDSREFFELRRSQSQESD